jgi:hypothetical protein
LAGSGKSTLLNSIAEHFRMLRQRGAFVFFDRSDPVNSDPSRVIPTIAYHLAQFSPLFAQKLDEQIRSQRDILRSPLYAQFQSLLEEPSKAVAAFPNHPPIIIIIDALDECGNEKSRKGLLEFLSGHIQKLPALFRILVASRDEKDIRSAFLRRNTNQFVKPVPLRIDDDATMHDIAKYFQHHLMSIATDSGLSEWPGPGVVDQLTLRAGGLFSWASTAIGFIEDGLAKERLRIVLNTSKRGESLAKLHGLYQLTLTEQFKSFRSEELDILCQILGAIVVARERLTDDMLSQLLGLDSSTVRDILSRLRSLVQWNPGEPIKVLHASFPDFLGDRDKCNDRRWHIDEQAHHRHLATACFGIMRNRLHFNICNLETSYYKNKAIDGIDELIARDITADLMYGCRYWADHLSLGVTPGSDANGLLAEVIFFLRKRFLFWLEVFSLKDSVGMVPTILDVAAAWCIVCICYTYDMQSNTHVLIRTGTRPRART